MQNAIFLMDFLSINQSSVNKYKHYLPYLRDNSHLPVLASPVQITNVSCVIYYMLNIIVTIYICILM